MFSTCYIMMGEGRKIQRCLNVESHSWQEFLSCILGLRWKKCKWEKKIKMEKCNVHAYFSTNRKIHTNRGIKKIKEHQSEGWSIKKKAVVERVLNERNMFEEQERNNKQWEINLRAAVYCLEWNLYSWRF